MAVVHENLSVKAPAYVLLCNGPSLCGRDVISALRLLQKINFADAEDGVSELKTKVDELFEPGGQTE